MVDLILNNEDSLPWVEKYRPSKLSQIVHHENIIYSLRKLIKKQHLPHMLFYGASGTGKTSTIIAATKKLYNNDANFMVLELNASDDRGINIVREEIKEFAECSNMFKNGVKLIILDEADSMTYDAQFALRRVIEKYSYNTRFCLICNYMNKIIGAIRSRCMQFRFAPISNIEMKKYLSLITEKEDVNITKAGMDSIIKLSYGDLRKAINIFQAVSMASDNIDTDICYYTLGICKPDKIKELILLLFDEKICFSEKFDKINTIIKNDGYSLMDLLSSFHNYIIENTDILKKFDTSKIIYLFDNLAILEEKLNASTFEDIYIGGLISIFTIMIHT